MKRRCPPAATQKVVLELTPEEQLEIKAILRETALWSARWLRRTIQEVFEKQFGGTHVAGRPN